MARYKKNEQFFCNEGFNFSIAEKVISLAQLSPWDAYYLFYYTKRIPDGGTYLEIGSMVGGSLVCAYEATKFFNVVVNFIAIEHSVRKELIENIKHIPRIKLIETDSDKAESKIVHGSVDVLFIDAKHCYESVKKDIENYWPKVKTGGILLGHDYTSSVLSDGMTPGVLRAVKEIFGEKGFVVLKNSWMFMVKR